MFKPLIPNPTIKITDILLKDFIFYGSKQPMPYECRTKKTAKVFYARIFGLNLLKR